VLLIRPSFLPAAGASGGSLSGKMKGAFARF
jgi:hypothetical protein